MNKFVAKITYKDKDRPETRVVRSANSFEAENEYSARDAAIISFVQANKNIEEIYEVEVQGWVPPKVFKNYSAKTLYQDYVIPGVSFPIAWDYY